jgi:hypothetical protein
MSTDRRDFLKFLFGGASLGVSLSPLEILIQSAIFQSQNQAMAQSALQKFYFNIAFPGAPDRVTYDLFLDPYGNGNNIIANPGVATCYGSSTGSSIYDMAIYKTVSIAKHGIQAPWMWGQKMPTSDGFKSISELMDNMMVIQGVKTASPGHPMSQNRAEEANGLTLAGVLSDATSTPLNAVQMSSPYSYKSASGGFITQIGESLTTNVINTLMTQFSKSRITTYANLKDNIASSFKIAVDNMNYDSSLRMPNSLNMKKTYEGAIDLVADSVQDFATIWNDSLSKYLDVTRKASMDRANFNGFLDKPIGVATARNGHYDLQALTGGNIQCLNPDVRDILTEESNTLMSSCFAVAEFIANSKYASAVNARVTAPVGMTQISATGNPVRRSITHDQHNVGMMVRTLTNAVMYRAVSSCVYEFRKFLQTQSKGFNFNDTVIRLNGDFSRAVRTNGTGADHGWQASNTVLFSGMIQAPIIAGRIYKDGAAYGEHSATYKGSWGVGAPVTINGVTTTLTQGNVISSIASMLGVRSPANNSPSLIRLRNSKVELVNADLKLKVVA